jgi:hypothetical protein
MKLRDELHRLVDSLPEGALQPAEQMLIHLQAWKPEQPVRMMPPELQRLRKDLMRRRMESFTDADRVGLTTGFNRSGNYSLAEGSGSSSQTHWEGNTLFVQTRHDHRGHVLDVEQRIRLQDDKHLIYKHHVVGPGKKSVEHEVAFEVAT